MLIPFPFAYLFGTACVNLVARAANRPDWARTAAHMRLLGIGSALAAAVPGLIDYLTAVPPKSSASKRATYHMLANVSALGLFAAAAAASRRNGHGNGHPGDDSRAPAWTVAAELAGAALLSAGGWMGGTLVYRNQIGVDHRYADAGKWEAKSLPPADGGDPIDLGEENQLEPDQMKLLRIGGERLVLARTDRGYVAFDDRCRHRGGPLSDGTLACGTVQCPWHGSQYDVHTGAVRRGPAEDAIRTYEVSARDGRLYLTMPAAITS